MLHTQRICTAAINTFSSRLCIRGTALPHRVAATIHNWVVAECRSSLYELLEFLQRMGHLDLMMIIAPDYTFGR